MNAIALRRLTLLCSIAAVAPSAPTLARQSTDDSSTIQNGRAGAHGKADDGTRKGLPVQVRVHAPERNHWVGIDGRGWMVDLEIDYDVPLARTGFTVGATGAPGFQLTGPAAHAGIAPFPGTFGPGADDRLPGLMVVLTTSTSGAGVCQNLANLFNLTAITDLDSEEVEIWDTWIVGGTNFGVGVASTLFVAVADDNNDDGVFNDAPAVIPDADGDGLCTQYDLTAFGVASNIEQVTFFINGPVDLSGLPQVP